jgi:hypothetical protein
MGRRNTKIEKPASAEGPSWRHSKIKQMDYITGMLAHIAKRYMRTYDLDRCSPDGVEPLSAIVDAADVSAEVVDEVVLFLAGAEAQSTRVEGGDEGCAGRDASGPVA